METYRDPALPFEQRAADLVSRMTIEEKMSQLNYDAPAIERLGVRAWTWWNEASHGVIPVFSAFREASSFPVCLALANTWDEELTQRVASAISDEMRAIHNLTGKELDYWCPTVNMGRDPRWGRNDEAFGEDPLLAGKLAAAYVRGIQGEDEKYLKAVSTPKHFAANNSEYNRNSSSSNVDEATLREYYLPVFERCVREGGAKSIMTAYNRIGSIPCSANEHLLQDILYDEWGFDGYIVSDDGAVGDVGPNHNLMWGQPRGHFYGGTMEEACALSLRAGTDICTGNDYKVFLADALKQGLVDEDMLDRALVRCFTARMQLGDFDAPEQLPWCGMREDAICSNAHAELARISAEESLVLLRNEAGLLPLKADHGKKLLVIGPNAIYRQLGGYSIGGFADTRVSVPPLSGIRELGETLGFTVDYCKGWNIVETPVDGGADRFPVLVRAAQEAGLSLEAYLDERTPEGVKKLQRELAARRAERAAMPMPEPRHPVADPDLGRSDAELWAEALDKAKQADVVLVIAGTDPGVTSEGRDRATLAMPYEQDEKLCALHAVNPKTAAVLITSGPVTGSFLTELPAILWAAYPGESQGTAIAKAVFGAISPSGRSSETWYPSDNCLPDIADYGIKPLDTPNQMGRTYEYWLGQPVYAFGYGLSYSSFDYSNFHLEQTELSPDDVVTAHVTVRNTGDMVASEVVQLYVKHRALWQNQPYRKLAAFRKIRLQPGESREVTLQFPLSDLRSWSYYDNAYRILPGSYSLWLGRSSAEEDQLAACDLQVSGKWHAPLAAVTLRCDKRILRVEETAELRPTAVLEDTRRLDAAQIRLFSSDPAVAVVENGVVRAIAPGLCTMTAELSRDGQTKTARLPLCVL